MNYTEFLLWVRGPAFHFATAILVLGLTLRFLEMLFLGSPRQYAAVRSNGIAGGIRTVISRFAPPEPGVFQRSWFIIVAGYLFHLGFFISFFLFAPHIILLKQVLGVSWPGLPAPVINIITIVSLFAMITLLINRWYYPVLRFLSDFEDYLSWTLAFLPLFTGYLAFHHIWLPYPLMLALHILSVEILMIVLPFTKLIHTFTFIIARWTNGARAAQKGVQV